MTLKTRGPETWGGWVLNIADYTLMLLDDDTGVAYEIDLEVCTSSAEVLDWLCQLAHKEWATPEVLGGLVHALDDVLRPQANLCSGGRDKRLTPAQVRQLVRRGRP